MRSEITDKLFVGSKEYPVLKRSKLQLLNLTGKINIYQYYSIHYIEKSGNMTYSSQGLYLHLNDFSVLFKQDHLFESDGHILQKYQFVTTRSGLAEISSEDDSEFSKRVYLSILRKKNEFVLFENSFQDEEYNNCYWGKQTTKPVRYSELLSKNN